ncbi:palmitoyltransferase PFA4 [Parastagonospora nodorum]|nr:palmitoyltransferase PFA4 [Parastagonospora nodorum]KAH4076642.1 palmitoyltransferase PFA4 [Parastagonospora nodorum]KAH4095877.1 palmitoyltransferase PFA4 [Parastagonospora nodorum]KAH4197628.1 palmitoyltransferase PFA4 [Parastagonospora nodorum]KAH4237082.1 palmitoyltransferase PFA4 [Parastagonospora nodorum]
MELSQLAVPSVYVLIFFLGYPSQWLLTQLEPRPLTKNELIFANVILVLIFITYTKSVFVDPGRIPKDWAEKQELGLSEETKKKITRKWCRKCEAPKPPRAHHCKACKRCIPKMDHHCPWTSSCVSHTTFPHFLRFLVSTTTGLSFLQLLLFTRLSHLWNSRHLPASLGPSPFLLFHLFATTLANSLTLFAVGILALRNIWVLAINVTTIEGWEIERHRTLLRRARHFGGYLQTPDGQAIRIKKQEFPYDIGILRNICQGMGSANPLMWFNPLAPSPSVQSALQFEVNGFEDEGTVWPPPDPDRSYKKAERGAEGEAFVFGGEGEGEDTIKAFRARQAQDVVRRRKPFVERLEDRVERDGYVDEYEYGEEASDGEEEEKEKYGEGEGEEGWRNSEGERLQDFGVDEDVEFYDEQEDEIPLAELMARRQAASSGASYP